MGIAILGVSDGCAPKLRPTNLICFFMLPQPNHQSNHPGLFLACPLLLLLLLIFSGCVPYPGESNTYVVYLDMKWEELVSRKMKFAAEGQMLVDVEISKDGKKYAGIWYPQNEDHVLWSEKNWPRFYDKMEEMRLQGYGLVDLEVNNAVSGGASNNSDDSFWNDIWSTRDANEVEITTDINKVVGIFSRGTTGTTHRFAQSLNKLVANKNSLHDEGFSILDIEVFLGPANQLCYAGVWREGRLDQQLRVGKEGEFTAVMNAMREQGYRMTDIELYQDKGDKYFLGLWSRATDDEKVLLRRSAREFASLSTELRQQNMVLVDVEIDDGTFSGIWRGDIKANNGPGRFLKLEYDGNTEREGDPGER